MRAHWQTEPRFIICDEPVSALDVSVQAAIINLLADLKDDLGLAYLFISHDLALVAQIADRIAVMYQGRIVELGTTFELLSPPFHPYTSELLSSVPRIHVGRPSLRLREVETGAPPVATNGCKYHPRCRRKLNGLCDRKSPPIQQIKKGHFIACHLPEDELTENPLA